MCPALSCYPIASSIEFLAQHVNDVATVPVSVLPKWPALVHDEFRELLQPRKLLVLYLDVLLRVEQFNNGGFV